MAIAVLQLQDLLRRRRHVPLAADRRQQSDLVLQPFELEQDRARVERIEHQQVDARVRRPACTL